MQIPTCEATDGCCKENSWPHQLQRVLQGQLGMHGSAVDVRNECVAAVGTDVFVLKFMTNESFRRALQVADIVVVEMATNDYPFSKADRIMNTELLVNLLQSLPNQPFLMWLSAAWANRLVLPWSHVDLDSNSNAEAEHLVVMRHYGIAHTSMLSLFQLSTHDSLQVEQSQSQNSSVRHRFLEDVYFQDFLHPGYLAHKMIAAVVARRLLQLLNLLTNTAAANWFGHADAAGHHPGFISTRAATGWGRYKSESELGYKVDLFDLEKNCSEVTTIQGFALELEGKRKWGHIGHQVGDAMLLRLPRNTFRVIIGAMHSYEHNGLMRVRVVELSTESSPDCDRYVSPSLIDEQCSSCVVLAEVLHDTRWSEKASTRHEVEIQISRSSRGQCQWLHISVVADPGRSENKVKLLGVSAFRNDTRALLDPLIEPSLAGEG